LSGMRVQNVIESESELVIQPQVSLRPLRSEEFCRLRGIRLEIFTPLRRSTFCSHMGESYQRDNGVQWYVPSVCDGYGG
jgi:hypothetical protein